ncbi:MAG: GIY-YIG nuclease family protein [Myxococcales bacterium]|nr:GIY-YIG nuclease family protein [Myxococcales bacterium]
MSQSPRVFHAYILRCSDGSYYVGHTKDLGGRVDAHNAGRGAVYTIQRRPVELAHAESFDSEIEAIQRERQIKRWSKSKKDALIRGDMKALKVLSQSRD